MSAAHLGWAIRNDKYSRDAAPFQVGHSVVKHPGISVFSLGHSVLGAVVPCSGACGVATFGWCGESVYACHGDPCDVSHGTLGINVEDSIVCCKERGCHLSSRET